MLVCWMQQEAEYIPVDIVQVSCQRNGSKSYKQCYDINLHNAENRHSSLGLKVHLEVTTM